MKLKKKLHYKININTLFNYLIDRIYSCKEMGKINKYFFILKYLNYLHTVMILNLYTQNLHTL